MGKYDFDDNDDLEDDFVFGGAPQAKIDFRKKEKAMLGKYDPKLLLLKKETASGDIDDSDRNSQGKPLPLALKQMVEYYHDQQGLATKDEGLDVHEFEDIPWVAPTVTKAENNKAEKVFRRGQEQARDVQMSEAQDLGEMTLLYFKLLKHMTYGFLVMTLLSIPSLLIAFSSSGTPEFDQDYLGLYRFTLGNVGFDTMGVDYNKNISCAVPNAFGADSHESCMTVVGHQLPYGAACLLITLFEILQNVAFLVTVYFLRQRVHEIDHRAERHRTASIQDYAVQIRGLPHDATEKEVVEHFSSLYPLDKPDWKKRKIVVDAKPVENRENSSGNPIFLDSWVADCTLYRRIGSCLRAFEKKEKLTRKLYKYRALMKMHASQAKRDSSASPAKYLRAESAMLKVAARIDHIYANAVLPRATPAPRYVMKAPAQVDLESLAEEKRDGGEVAALVAKQGAPNNTSFCDEPPDVREKKIKDRLDQVREQLIRFFAWLIHWTSLLASSCPW